MKWVWVLFLLVAGGAARTHPSDTAALRDLLAALDPTSIFPGSCLSTWDFTADPCDSLSSTLFTCGFRCDALDSAGAVHVTEISLDATGYSGALSPSVSSLSYLRLLDVSNNKLSGAINLSLSTLRHLSVLSLSRNAFSGTLHLPAANLPVLSELYVDGNTFSGSFPECIPKLLSLQILELQTNNFSGVLPDLSPLSNLISVDVSDNGFTGNLPSLSFSLIKFAARNNSLTGFFSKTFFMKMKSLQVLDLSYNGFSGEIPVALFTLPALQQLSLSHNKFSSLEEGKGMAGEIVAVDLGYNRLHGRLPTGWMRRMPKLAALSMEENKLTGRIPAEYAARVAGSAAAAGESKLERLLLAGNYFYGAVPAALAGVKEGDAVVSLEDNCLVACPRNLFFCHGRRQKTLSVCRAFDPFIP